MNIMPYIVNKDIKIKYYLKKIYGISFTKSMILCKELGLDLNYNLLDLSVSDKKKLEDIIFIKKKYKLESDLKKINHDNIKTKKQIRNYQGVRHSLNLPVNGQNTKTNAKTQK